MVDKAGEMECKVSGSTPFSISWYRDDEELHSGPACDISFSDNSCTLRVATLKLSDSGRYRCKAINEAGSSETSATLDVKGKRSLPCSNADVGGSPFLVHLPPREVYRVTHRQTSKHAMP